IANNHKDLSVGAGRQNLCWSGRSGEAERFLGWVIQIIRFSAPIVLDRMMPGYVVSIVKLESDQVDRFTLCEIREIIPPNGASEVTCTVHECRPFRREIVPKAKEEREAGPIGLLEQFIQCAFDFGRVHALARSVADMQDDI